VGPIELKMSGRHNRLNALAVCALALDEGIALADLQRGLATFSGIQRRQQVLGDAGGVTVIDDFAHHPTAVRATLEAISERFSGRRILAIFEPRTNSSRRKVFESPYTDALSTANAVFLSAPPFRHNDDPNDFMDVDAVIKALESRGIDALARSGADALLPEILSYARPGDVAVIMSNGAFGGIHRRLLQNLQD
jgi:UDP-N-acetylmuramate: L-alanyl-gamma-D-glutamyl-meso-diaminopimelate ligase